MDARGWMAAALAGALCAIGLAACGGSHEQAKPVGDCPLDDPRATLVYAARPTPDVPVSPASLDLTVRRMCDRARRFGDHAVGVRRAGARQVEVELADPNRLGDAGSVTRTARLAFYDWEPNVYGDPDKPVISLYDATRTAARAKPRAEKTDIPPGGPSGKSARYYDLRNDTGGDRYYVFGPDKQIVRPAQGNDNDATAFYATPQDAEKAAGTRAGSKVVKVPRGIVVVKAEKSGASAASALGYWVLEDDAELSGDDIRDPKQNFDPQTTEPIVTFTFTDVGRKAFARVTKREADRGAHKIVPPGTPKDATFQRFAIVLDQQVVSLATISYIDNPEGIDGSTGAQINGIGNLRDTQQLADDLATGALPLELALVRVER